MKKLISFSLFLSIILILLAAKSVDAQVVVRPRLVVAPVVVGPPICPMPRYPVVRVYPRRMMVPHPYRHWRRPVVRARFGW